MTKKIKAGSGPSKEEWEKIGHASKLGTKTNKRA